VTGCAGGAATPADAYANPTTAGLQMAFNMGWNGATWDRFQMDGSKNLKVASSSTLVNDEAALTAGTAPSKGVATLCQYNSSAPAPTNGQTVAVQCDANGAMYTNPGTLAAANDHVDIGAINGVTPLMGAGNTGTGSPRVTIATDQAAIAAAGQGATGSAVPSGAVYMGAKSTGNLTGLIQCDSSVLINTASAATAELVSLTSSQVIYICGWEIHTSSASANNVNLAYGTGTNCGTGTTVLSSIVRFPAGVTGLQGKVSVTPFFKGMKTAASNALCVTTSAAVQVDGVVYYTKF